MMGHATPFPQHWLSVHHYIASKSSLWNLMISVILSGGTHENFSAIRIIILEDPSTDTGLREIGSEKAGVSLERRRAAAVPLIQNLPGKQKPLCTIAFGLQLEPGYGIRNGRFEIHLLSGIDTPKRVVYDNTYSYDSCSHSLSIYFECRGRIARRDLPVAWNDYPSWAMCVNVLPVERKSAQVRLPQHALHEIFKYALENSSDWRRRVIVYGSVCKSWSIIYDLFFGRICDHNSDRVDINALARSLCYRPDRGRLLRTIDLYKLDSVKGAFDEGRMKTLVAILKTASLVHNILLDGLREPLDDEAMEVLANMTEVQNASFSSYKPNSDMNPSRYVPLNVLNSIANWAKLERLAIKYWDTVDLFDDLTELQSPNFRLQSLVLSCGNLNGAWLRWFTLAPAICLKVVELQSIDGLSNSDLFYFLNAISATLKSLSIIRCPIPRYGAEELAFDAALSKMTALQYASVYGDIASTVAIARSVQPISDNREQMKISIRGYLPHSDLLPALERTSWNAISLDILSTAWDEILIDQAREIGRRRSLELCIYRLM